MGSFPVIVPPAPGLLCAIGDLVADFRDEFAQTYIRLVAQASGERGGDHPRRPRRAGDGVARGRGNRRGRAQDLVRRGHALPPAGLRDPGRARPGRGARRRARRPRGAVQRATRAAVRLPDARHGVRDRQPARGRLRRRAAARAPHRRAGPAPTRRAPSSTSTTSSSTAAACATKIYDRAKLEPGAAIAGPAIVTEFDSTTVILPGHAATVDANYNILITPSA